MTDPILQLRGVTKQFGGLVAVNDVTFSINGDEGITAVIGPNGAGKTTLYNLITGHLPVTSGTITFNGEDITSLNARERALNGLGRSFQITNIFDGLTVRENIRAPLLARSNDRLNPLDRIDGNDRINQEADDIIDLVGLTEEADVVVENLSYGDRRRIDIGIAIAMDPELLLLDEPTAGTATSETNRLVELIENLHSETGVAVVIVEHNMDVVFDIASRILVLNRGEILVDGTPTEIQGDERVQTAYLGESRHKTPAEIIAERSISTEPSTAEPMLSVDSIDTYYGDSHILQDLSLQVYPGEIVGILGRNGAGKTTTMRSIMGLTPPKNGSITFDGERIDGLEPHEISKKGIGYVPQEREVFADLSVEDNLSIIARSGSDWTIDRVYEVFPRLQDRKNQKAGTLSGGEQQMLTISRALVTGADMLVMDEISEGLAPVIIDDLQEILESIVTENITVILTEQNLQFASKLADRGYIIDKGQIQWTGSMEELANDEELIGRYLALSEV